MNSKEIMDILSKHWSDAAAFTDITYITENWQQKIEEEGEKVPEEELWDGELAAFVFRVGNYHVRVAHRIYRICKSAVMYDPQNEKPVNKAEMELIKKDAGVYVGQNRQFRLAQEIAAKSCGTSENDFIIICRLTHAVNYSWCESVKCICTAKKSKCIPDEDADLFVWKMYVGDSFSVDTVYKMEPTGRITELVLHPFDPDIGEAEFRER